MDIPFKFRDYAVHLFPGLMFLIGIYEIAPVFQSQLKENPISGIIVIIIIGYFIGFISDAMTHNLTRKLIRRIRIFEDPFKKDWDKIKDKNNTLHFLAISILRKELGDEIIEKERPNRLIYYCLRVVENEASSSLANLPSRILSLENITINIMPPLLFVSMVLIIKGEVLVAMISVSAFIAMPFRNVQYRKWLLRIILASYVAVRNKNL